MQNRDASRRLIAGSAIIGSIGTFSLHVLLPALPAIASAMQVEPHAAQLLISLSILAIALGNLMVAPLSDRYGRRPIVLFALGLFVLGSAAGIVAESLDTLVAARVVQAFGGGAAMSVMRATILDHFGPARAASALAATATAILIAPMLAPTIGGFVLEWLDWRAVFALSGILGFAVFLFASRNLRDARRADRSAGPSLRYWSSYRRLLGSREYLAFLVYGSCMVSMIYTFVTGAPYVAIDVLGVSPSRFGLLLFFPAVASFSGFLLAARMTGRIGGQRMMRAGAMIASPERCRWRASPSRMSGIRSRSSSPHGHRLRQRDRGALVHHRRDLARSRDRGRRLGVARVPPAGDRRGFDAGRGRAHRPFAGPLAVVLLVPLPDRAGRAQADRKESRWSGCPQFRRSRPRRRRSEPTR